MKDTTRDLLNTAIALAYKSGNLQTAAVPLEAFQAAKADAKVAYDSLFQYIEYLEANCQPAPPDFYRQSREPLDEAMDLLAGGVRYTK